MIRDVWGLEWTSNPVVAGSNPAGGALNSGSYERVLDKRG
jgi:hypothetical protein